MTDRHDELRVLLGAYVLGGLDATDRARLEEHLEGCGECREELARFASLPALLHRAGPPIEPAEPDAAGWDQLLAAARAERLELKRRRKWIAAAAAVVILAAASIGTMVFGPFDRPGTPFVAMAGANASGHADLEARPWGTALSLRLAGLADEDRFVVWVVAEDGRREQAAIWGATPNGAAEVSGASSIRRNDVALVRVTTGGGRPLLQMRLDS